MMAIALGKTLLITKKDVARWFQKVTHFVKPPSETLLCYYSIFKITELLDFVPNPQRQRIFNRF